MNSPEISGHLTKEIANKVLGVALTSYALSLEAWRRGLTVTVHDRDMRRYTICTGRLGWRNGVAVTVNRGNKIDPLISINRCEKRHTFYRIQIQDRHFKKTKFICNNKDVTKKFLLKAGIPVPEGQRFSNAIPNEDIVKYVLNHLSFPVVVKPATGRQGRGVFVNIEHVEALKKFLVHVREDLGYGDVIVEKHITGEDYRLFVLGDKVLSVVKRIPANITGDGKHSIKELIEHKNILRKKNPHLARRLIEIDQEVFTQLHRAGYDLDSIPKKGTLLFLRGISNLSTGGDSIDVTDEASETLKSMAVRAVKAIPHLSHCGVDVLVNKTGKDQETAVIIELNYLANLMPHVFPAKGKSRDVVGGIIDHYFPESSGRIGKCKKLYFNIKILKEQFDAGIVTDLTLPKPPLGRVTYRRIELKGIVPEDIKKLLQRKAIQLNIFGHVRDLKNGNVRVVLAGKKKDIDAFKSFLSTEMKVEIVKETGWKKPVAAGFHIK